MYIGAILFPFVLTITSVKVLLLLSTHYWWRPRMLSIIWWIISCGEWQQFLDKWHLLIFRLIEGEKCIPLILGIPIEKKSHTDSNQMIRRTSRYLHAMRSNDWGTSPSLKIPIERLEVWAVASSCWTQTLFLLSSSSSLGFTKVSGNVQYRSELTVTVTLSSKT